MNNAQSEKKWISTFVVYLRHGKCQCIEEVLIADEWKDCVRGGGELLPSLSLSMSTINIKDESTRYKGAVITIYENTITVILTSVHRHPHMFVDRTIFSELGFLTLNLTVWC